MSKFQKIGIEFEGIERIAEAQHSGEDSIHVHWWRLHQNDDEPIQETEAEMIGVYLDPYNTRTENKGTYVQFTTAHRKADGSRHNEFLELRLSIPALRALLAQVEAAQRGEQEPTLEE